MTFGTLVGEADATAIIRRALELGINFIVTANICERISPFHSCRRNSRAHEPSDCRTARGQLQARRSSAIAIARTRNGC
jgi:hypothetical protein